MPCRGPSGPRVTPSYLQRVRTDRAARAAAPAVEVRSTSAPRRTACAPAARKATTSPSVSPPSGPTTTATVPDARDQQLGQRTAGLLVQDHGEVGVAQQAAHLAGGHQVGDLGHPRTAGLLAGRARRGPPLRHALGDPVLAPAGDAAGRRPRHDPVDAELGGELDGQRPAVALGQRLHQHQLRLGRGHLVPRPDAHAQAARRRRSTTSPSATVPRPSPTRTRSPGGAAARRRRAGPRRRRPAAPRRRAPRPAGTAARRRARGRPRRRSSSSAPVERVADPGEQPALRLAVRVGLVLAAQRGQLAQQLLLLGSSRVGVETSTCTSRLPRPVPRSRGAPWARRVSTLPDWVPGRMSRSSSPSRVFRLSVVPSAAAVIGRVTRQCRSSPSRVNTSCGRSWIST